ncbi:MAG: hypothetical protein K1X81_01135 [Bacteroidia bacterium]|nr:hypothetical protein [Bacteroidia bacterium]
MSAIKITLLLLSLLITFTAFAQTTSLRANEIHMEIMLEDGQVTILWNTMKEVNTSYFVIEKSEDSLHYTALKMVSAAGNSVFARHYQITETEPAAGKVYYRVRLVTMNGQQIASAPVITNTGSMANMVSK